MVNEGIVLGHKISERGIEVDKAKVDAIENMSCPKDIKGIRSFLGHAGFYRRFIKDFSKISRPLTDLLQKYIPFVFDDDCVEAFETLKKALITPPIVQPPKMYSSVVFSIFTELCNHHHNQFQKIFITPKKTPFKVVLNFFNSAFHVKPS